MQTTENQFENLAKGTVIKWLNGHSNRTGRITHERKTVREYKTEYLVLDLDDELGSSAHWVALSQIQEII